MKRVSQRRGANAVEYILLTGLVALGSLGGAQLFGGKIDAKTRGQGEAVLALRAGASIGAPLGLAPNPVAGIRAPAGAPQQGGKLEVYDLSLAMTPGQAPGPPLAKFPINPVPGAAGDFAAEAVKQAGGGQAAQDAANLGGAAATGFAVGGPPGAVTATVGKGAVMLGKETWKIVQESQNAGRIEQAARRRTLAIANSQIVGRDLDTDPIPDKTLARLEKKMVEAGSHEAGSRAIRAELVEDYRTYARIRAQYKQALGRDPSSAEIRAEQTRMIRNGGGTDMIGPRLRAEGAK